MLCASGWFGKCSAKKALISYKNYMDRSEFFKRHLHCTSKDWAIVQWSNQSKIGRLFSGPVKDNTV